MTNLAIRGHKTRGKEVIEILKMFGASNPSGYNGSIDDWYYYIENDKIVSAMHLRDFIVFTLEEFLEKFPYKVGDKVEYIKYDNNVYEIIGIIWTGNTIEYTLDSFGFTCLAEDIRPCKKTNINMNKRSKGLESLNVETYLKVWDETEYGLEVCVAEGYEMIEKDGQFYIVKQKTKYPRDFDECCEVLFLGEDGKLWTERYKASLIQDFQKLLICRDAYWKIAGEQMGLGKPWEPDWTKSYNKFCIINMKNKIVYDDSSYISKLLAFPTLEVRDAFYENFKDLIEKCKELL